MTPPLTSVVPTWNGAVNSFQDACLLILAVRMGVLPEVKRKLNKREKTDLIKPGNVFVFEEGRSGVVRWNDHLKWYGARYSGCFILYDERPDDGPTGTPGTLTRKTVSVNCIGADERFHVIAYLDGSETVQVCQDPRFQNLNLNISEYSHSRSAKRNNKEDDEDEKPQIPTKRSISFSHFQPLPLPSDPIPTKRATSFSHLPSKYPPPITASSLTPIPTPLLHPSRQVFSNSNQQPQSQPQSHSPLIDPPTQQSVASTSQNSTPAESDSKSLSNYSLRPPNVPSESSSRSTEPPLPTPPLFSHLPPPSDSWVTLPLPVNATPAPVRTLLIQPTSHRRFSASEESEDELDGDDDGDAEEELGYSGDTTGSMTPQRPNKRRRTSAGTEDMMEGESLEERAEARRRKNALAARKCRAQKASYVESLEKRLSEVTTLLNDSERDREILRIENERLKGFENAEIGERWRERCRILEDEVLILKQREEIERRGKFKAVEKLVDVSKELETWIVENGERSNQRLVMSNRKE